MNRRVRLFLMIVLPFVILAGAALGAFAIISTKPEVETQRPEIPPPLVRVREAVRENVALTVTSQGTVRPRTESQLVTEVAGRILGVSPSFVPGGFFRNGAVLVRIDPSDYEQAVVLARAEVARARLRLAQEEAEAEVARGEWDEIGDGMPSPLTLREPQLEESRAALAAAEANLSIAERNLARTTVKAPFAGRVREKFVDVGQYVTPGSRLATVYSVEAAEVRLPIPDADLAFIDVPLGARGGSPAAGDPRVTLRAAFAGDVHEWAGRIVRTEGEIDALSRLVNLVARVDDPYVSDPGSGRPPLAVGMFVEAEIEGRTAEGVFRIPRGALRGDRRVYVVDRDGRLHFREVDVLRVTRDDVVIESGLEEGERVCLSPLEAATDGMRVQAMDDEGRDGSSKPLAPRAAEKGTESAS